MKKIFLAILILVFSSSLCLSSSDYLPVFKEGTIRSFHFVINIGSKNSTKTHTDKRIYKTLSPRKLAGKKVYPQILKSGNIVYQCRDNFGVYMIAQQSPSDVEPRIEEKQHYDIKYPIKVGTKWQGEITTWMLDKKDIDISYTKEIVSMKEIVVVPAGTFENCMLVKSYGKRVLEEQNSYVDSGFWVSLEAYAWYAPKIGFIKSINRQNTDHTAIGEFTEIILMLEEYKEPD